MGDKVKTAAEVAEDAALAGLYEVHADPEAPNAGKSAIPRKMVEQPPAQKSPAQWAYERIILYLKNFEESLDSEHEAAMGFTGGDAGVLRIEGMGYFDPDIVTFYGSDPTGAKLQLIQHVSQLNVMLRAVPKAVDEAEPNRIGFRLAQDLEKS